MNSKEFSPVSELVERLRGWPLHAFDTCREAADRLTALEAEVRRCHARLEIDHHFILDGEDAEKLVRVEIPYEDRGWQVDGIEARDATIKELDRQIESLTALEAEVARRGAEIERMRKERDTWRDNFSAMHQQTMTAEARAAELDKALEWLIEAADSASWAANIGTMDNAIEAAHRVREGGKD